MFKFKIITDSTSGISYEEAQKLDITVLPLTLSYEGKDYKDGIDITTDEFYNLFFKSKNKEFPKTSQIPPLVFKDAYDKIINDGYTPVVLTISSALSGTHQSAILASELVDHDVVILDTHTALGCVGIIAEHLNNTEYETKEDLINDFNYLHDHVNLLAVTDTLEFLYKGGRLNKTQAVVGNLLQLKPVIQVDSKGKLNSVHKVRGLKHAFNKLVDMLKEFPIDFKYNFKFGYSTQIENVNQLISQCKDYINNITNLIQISPVIGAHVGPGASAIFYISTKKVDK